MATVVTRSLSLEDRFDKVAIKVNPEDYEELWGILEIIVTNYAWGEGATAGDYGFIDLRPPQYNEDSDNVLLDNVDLEASGGTEAVTLKYYIAVNNGVPGPAAFVQPDGSWDLLHLKFELPEDNVLAPLAVTLTYTVAFTDLTPVSNPADDGTITLNVNNSKTSDSGLITEPAATFTAKNGYTRVQINDLHLTNIDRPVDPLLTDSLGAANDSVPMFTVVNERAQVGFGKTNQIVNHPCSKISGTRTYKEKLMIFAINNGKADGNATNVKASAAYVSFFKPTIQKIANWPCDDWVTGIVDYALDFTEVV